MLRLLASACVVLLWAANSSAQTADPTLLERAKALLDSAPLNTRCTRRPHALGRPLVIADR